MKRRALVITRTPDFGDQIVQALELDGRFAARAYTKFSTALEDGQREPFDLVVLDADAADQPFDQAAQSLRRVCPNTALILVPQGNWVSSTLLNRVTPDGLITKPLCLAEVNDLLDEIHHRYFVNDAQPKAAPPLVQGLPGDHTSNPTQSIAAEPSDISAMAEKRESPPQNGRGLVVVRKRSTDDPTESNHGWLYDVNRAAQYLARLSMETSAQAALILRSGKIWAYAGQVSQPDAQELAQAIVTQWGRAEPTPSKNHDSQGPDRRDLIRFARLASEQEYIMYATGLVDNLVLVLAFDADIPFRMIRSQAVHLAQALAQPPETVQSQPQGNPPNLVARALADQPITPATRPPMPGAAHATANLPFSNTSNSIAMPILLDDVPPSNPGRGAGVTPPTPPPSISQPRPEIPSESPDRSHLEGVKIPAGLPISPAILHTGRPDLDSREESSAPPPAVQSPFLNPLEQHRMALEPVSPALSGLMYTCVMVPRIPTHVLSGDLAARLTEWLPLLCLAYGWRLEKLEQRKEYLAWVVRVQLDTSPSYFMRILRQQTSQRIFSDFPALLRENPSGDFWAPGYLILSSGALPTPDIIRSFIQQTRFYQGGTGPIILSTTR